MKHVINSLLILFIVSSCGYKRDLVQVQWRKSSGKSIDPSLLLDIKKDKSSKDNLMVSYDKYGSFESWRSQEHQFPIKGTWLNVKIDKTNSIESIDAKIVSNKPNLQELKWAQQFESRKNIILSELWKKFPEIRNASLILQPKIVLVPKILQFEPFLEVVFYNQNQTDVTEWLVSSTANVIEKKSLKNELTDGNARVFLSIPEQTDLTKVIFKNLVGDGTLTSSILKIESDSVNRAFSSTHEFIYPLNAQAFDEVQAYHYVQKALDWFDENFQLKLPFQLKVKVHVGGLTPSNAAFYYQGRIRLGDGDGIIYKDMAKDPTIVIHEASHAVVDALAGLPNEGQGGSLNEGFADFFSAHLMNTPNMAQFSYLKSAFKRTLENDITLSQINGGKYHDSGLISGTLWDIRKEIDNQNAAYLAYFTLRNLNPSSQVADFLPAIQEAMQRLDWNSELNEKVHRILIRRGWL